MPKPIHFEIHAQNPERAIAFYTSVFGWSIQKTDGPMEYWLILAGPEGEPGINGAILRGSPAVAAEGATPNAFVCTIGVENVDETLLKIKAGGGSEQMPKGPIPGMGWLAYAKDTEGNIFGILQFDPNAA